MHILVVEQPFDPWQSIAEFEAKRSDRERAKSGAQAVFVGTMRDFNAGATVASMHLEHYPGMTERQLERLVEAALVQHGCDEGLVIHRVGEIRPGDPIVLVAVWSAQRGPAFDACRQVIEQLKSQAPFWKYERLDSESRWVSGNTDGYTGAGR